MGDAQVEWVNMDNGRQSIVLEQALHGYKDGHRLLCSSLRLSKAAMRTMLMLSDISGSSTTPAFDSYLTGYQLPDESLYAFARTWYAHEMQRPGCVWTHTLLIPTDALSHMHDLVQVGRFFRRPVGGSSFSGYEEHIALPMPESNWALGFRDMHGSHIPFVRQLLTGLYGGTGSRPVFVLAESAEEYEGLIIALWEQQWPGLRKRFSFCSGSLSNRSTPEMIFDLQVFPKKVLAGLKREVAEACFVDFEALTSEPPDADQVWVDVLLDDLYQVGLSPFRQYLWRVGQEDNAARSDLRKLASLYGDVRALDLGSVGLEDLISRVGQNYPNPDQAPRLKRALLGPHLHDRDEPFFSMSQSRTLCALARTEHSESFSPDLLDLRSRAHTLWRTDDSEFRDCIAHLITMPVNALAEELLAGVADAIQADELIGLSKADRRIVFAFVERRPFLASHRELWTSARDYQCELLDHFSHSSPPADLTELVIKAILDVGADGLADDTYRHFGTTAIRVFLLWSNEQTEHLDHLMYRHWIRLLTIAPMDALNWLREAENPKPSTVTLIASQLDPHAIAVRAFGTEIWVKVLNSLDREFDQENQRALAEFLLPFSLHRPGPYSHKLAKFSFGIINEALAKDQLDYEGWRRLDPILPKLPWYKSWDRCERLRLGMQEAGFGSIVDGR
jgi:hypothetical protein